MASTTVGQIACGPLYLLFCLPLYDLHYAGLRDTCGGSGSSRMKQTDCTRQE